MLKVPDGLNRHDVHVHGGEVKANVQKLTREEHQLEGDPDRETARRKEDCAAVGVKPVKVVIAPDVQERCSETPLEARTAWG